jgi:hypothetical protein
VEEVLVDPEIIIQEVEPAQDTMHLVVLMELVVVEEALVDMSHQELNI